MVDFPAESFLVGLSSVHWREAWKYGERAFRYCLHDVGHALGTMRFAAAALGWQLYLLDGLSSAAVSQLLGLDRDADYAAYGAAFYKNLFWEAGLVGQVLYLEAEEAGIRATGIGCYFDDPVHEVLGISSRDWQSFYHFTVGAPVEDSRLTTLLGYDREAE